MCDSPADSRVTTLAKRDTKSEPVYRWSEKVQDKVKAAIENMTGLEVSMVNIRIASVNMEKVK